jgi:hypothetical protein
MQQLQKDSSKQILTLKTLSLSLLKDSSIQLSPTQAWDEGTNIKQALAIAPEMVRGWIVSEVGRMIKELNYKVTIQSDEELMFCCRSIIEEHPTLKLEEIRVCFNMIRKGKYGKMFERLKTPEILTCLQTYQGETRAEILEQRAKNKKHEATEKTDEVLQPLGLVELYDKLQVKEHVPTKEGIGTRLKKKNKWDK